MAYEVTATRKRPQDFASLAGQEFVVSTITNAISQGRIAHAYLFSGPRGVGKTTTARLLAKALNCEEGPTANPCNRCDNCNDIKKGCSVDVIEIDGASNTSVNDIRNIKDEISFPPAHSRYKIYIIDEVHMLSNSAFNALLKTIEEPPEYVIFIFATTETQKVPATIRSRCQQFNFRLLSLSTIKERLAEAAEESGCKADDDALLWIAKESTGSMRDAYTLFDQVVSFSDGEITLKKIREKLGLIGLEGLNEIMTAATAGKKDRAIDSLAALLERGVSIEQCIKDFADYFRTILLIRKGVKNESVLGESIKEYPKEVIAAYTEEQIETALDMFLNLYRDIRYSLSPRFELELAISRLSTLRYLCSNATVVERIAKLKNDLISGRITPAALPEEEVQEISYIKTGEPEAQPAIRAAVKEQQPEDIPEPAPEPEHKPAPEPQPQPEPVPEPVPEPKPEPEPQQKKEPSADEVDFSVVKQWISENDPSVSLTLRSLESAKAEDGKFVLTYASSFSTVNATAKLAEIRNDFLQSCGYKGEIVIRQAVKKEEEKHDEQQKSELDLLINQMFGGTRE